MAKSFMRVAILLMVCCGGATTAADADTKHAPLRQAELLALVAGNVLPENIVREMGTDGLAFHPDDAYRSLLSIADADPTVLKALDSAKVIFTDGVEDRASKELLQHISDAGKLIKSKHYDEAAKQLTEAVTDSFKNPECAFVMGELLRQQEDWERAEVVYEAVLSEDPDFPEAHTKLSYILYRTGDGEESLREAKSALALTQDNAEAHKNAGLALATMRKFDAAIVEYREALRLKPDYWAVHMDLGLMYADKGAWDDSIVEYRKAIALDASEADAFYNMGYAYDQKGDFESAIREYAEASRAAGPDDDRRISWRGQSSD